MLALTLSSGLGMNCFVMFDERMTFRLHRHALTGDVVLTHTRGNPAARYAQPDCMRGETK